MLKPIRVIWLGSVYYIDRYYIQQSRKGVPIYSKTTPPPPNPIVNKPLKTYPFYQYRARVILYQFNKRLYSRCHKSVINHSRVAFELLFRSYPRNGCIYARVRIHRRRPSTISAVSAHVRLFWYSRKLVVVYGISSPDIPIVCHAKQAHYEIIITTWSPQ